jgi:membrane fusion protein (multidrug efflux system)
MYIDFSVAAQDRMQRQQLEREGRLRFPEGQIYKARLRLLDGRMYGGEGKVDFIDSQVQATTGVIRCRATFDNSKGEIMPGQYVRIYMEGDTLVQALLVPQTAVAIAKEGNFVMVVGEGNVAKRTKVEIGPAIGKDYLVYSGLKSGDRIVADGMLKARDGAPVTPAGAGGKAPAPAGQQGGKSDAGSQGK